MKYLLSLLLIAFSPYVFSQSSNAVINSSYLKRSVEIIIKKAKNSEGDLPIVYVTDGKKFIDNGLFAAIEKLQSIGKVPAAHYVFVSTVSPDDQVDYRNEYFFCNPDYLTFFQRELIPQVEAEIGSSFSPTQRSLIGISFGGLNAAYFAAQDAPFQNYALLSPVTYPCKELNQKIIFGPQRGLRIF
ncbi:MAG: alpha/beta hydrolase-fold protein, partial [Bacteroidota bacterium]